MGLNTPIPTSPIGSTLALTPREHLRRVAAIRQQLGLAREQLGAALAAMDYGQALAFQIEMDDLEADLRRVERGDGHEPY
jgi:hypothetical protein